MQLSIHHNQPPETDTINHHQISTPIYAAIYRRQIYTGFDHRYQWAVLARNVHRIGAILWQQDVATEQRLAKAQAGQRSAA